MIELNNALRYAGWPQRSRLVKEGPSQYELLKIAVADGYPNVIHATNRMLRADVLVLTAEGKPTRYIDAIDDKDANIVKKIFNRILGKRTVKFRLWEEKTLRKI